MNVGGDMQALYFEKHAINKQVHVEMEVDKMYKDNYETEIHKLLRWDSLLSKNTRKSIFNN